MVFLFLGDRVLSQAIESSTLILKASMLWHCGAKYRYLAEQNNDCLISNEHSGNIQIAYPATGH